MPLLVDDPAGRPSHPVSQQATPMNPFFDQSTLPPGPITRWQGPGQPWAHHQAQESPLVAGTLSPLSQFNPGWHQPPASNRPWPSPSQTSSTIVPPQWSSTPTLHGPQDPIDPSFTGYTQSAQSETTTHNHPWDWARRWPRGNERSTASSVTSSPDSKDSPGDRALTPFQTLSRHDSATTISSGYSKSSTTTPVPANQLALATGRPPQQWRADFKMPRTGFSALVHRKKRSIAYPGE
jgi:hypothetical protein